MGNIMRLDMILRNKYAALLSFKTLNEYTSKLLHNLVVCNIARQNFQKIIITNIYKNFGMKQQPTIFFQSNLRTSKSINFFYRNWTLLYV